MRKGQRAVFKNPEALTTMLNFRRSGVSVDTLALYFNCHHTTVMYQCELYGVKPINEVFSVYTILKPVLKLQQPQEQKWKIVDGERVARGRNYADYLRDFPHRKTKAFW